MEKAVSDHSLSVFSVSIYEYNGDLAIFIFILEYKLFAFISHMGTSTQSGHYVCHIKKGGQWVLFNDAKVARSEDPPKDMAYLYIYQRV